MAKIKKKSSVKNKAKSSAQSKIRDKLKKLKLKGKKSKKIAPKSKTSKQKSRKAYTPAQLTLAIKAVNSGLSVRKAATRFDIPSTTLFRHSKDPEKDWKQGAQTVFSAAEEQEIVDWIKSKAERGFPTDREELFDCVEAYVKSLGRKTPFTDGRPGRHWFEWFNKRHPDLTERIPQHLTTTRASVSEECIREWFADIAAYFEKKNLLNLTSSQFFNCDETNIHLSPKTGKVITLRGSRTVYQLINAVEKESVTVLFTYSADGTRAPPLVLYKYEQGIPQKVRDSFQSGWGIGNSETGWMTTETFYEYVANVFYPWLVRNKIQFPVVLFVDGHSSHMTLPLSTWCRDHSIEIIGLYPNSTHILQPLDVAFFRPFKAIWKRTVRAWRKENNLTRLTKPQFATVLKKALDTLDEQHIIENGFRTSGLYPLNPDAVGYDIFQKKGKKKISKKKKKENDQLSMFKKIKENKDFLHKFEMTLAKETLEQFKQIETTGVWIGMAENIGLYNHWLKLKMECIPETSVIKPQDKPFIKSICLLENPIHIRSLPQESSSATNPAILISQPAFDSNGDLSFEAIPDQPYYVVNDLSVSDKSNSVEQESNFDNAFNNQLNAIEYAEETVLQHTNAEDFSNRQINAIEYTEEPVWQNTSGENYLNHQLNAFEYIEVPVPQNENFLPSKTLEDPKNDPNIAHNQVVDTLKTDQMEIKSPEEETVRKETSKENAAPNIKLENPYNVFNTIFKLPEKYLPQKKKEKLHGRKKFVAACTSDAWNEMYKVKEEKEEARKKMQEEKNHVIAEKKKLDIEIKEIEIKVLQAKKEEKKALQEQKKAVVEKKKELDFQLKAMQLKIKQEYPSNIKIED